MSNLRRDLAVVLICSVLEVIVVMYYSSDATDVVNTLVLGGALLVAAFVGGRLHFGDEKDE